MLQTKPKRSGISRRRKQNEIGVSDHAVVRYIQRVIGIDIDEIKNQIMPESMRKSLHGIGLKNKVSVSENHYAVLEDDVVVTVLTKEEDTY